MKKAFTLAEMMIVLVVIAVITAILLPAARHATPDENILKFKKAHNTLYATIRELVNSDKYYLDGDLGVKADGTQIFSKGEIENSGYFCTTFADVISTKKVDCKYSNSSNSLFAVTASGENGLSKFASQDGTKVVKQVTEDTIKQAKTHLDNNCKKRANVLGEEIVTNDNIVYYNIATTTFGSQLTTLYDDEGNIINSYNLRFFSPPNQHPANYADQNGFDIAYRVFCMDIDGIPENGSEDCDDIKDICPFGYGIRADGKILNGKRADEWFEKSIQSKD